jgi:hypothetical protein
MGGNAACDFYSGTYAASGATLGVRLWRITAMRRSSSRTLLQVEYLTALRLLRTCPRRGRPARARNRRWAAAAHLLAEPLWRYGGVAGASGGDQSTLWRPWPATPCRRDRPCIPSIANLIQWAPCISSNATETVLEDDATGRAYQLHLSCDAIAPADEQTAYSSPLLSARATVGCSTAVLIHFYAGYFHQSPVGRPP